MLINNLFNDNDILNAIDQTNLDKPIGPDFFDSAILLKGPQIKDKMVRSMRNWLNNGHIPEYLLEGRLTLLTKNISCIAKVDNTRLLVILSQIRRILEKVINKKISDLGSKLLKTKSY